jgi:hypothetical protein
MNAKHWSTVAIAAAVALAACSNERGEPEDGTTVVAPLTAAAADAETRHLRDSPDADQEVPRRAGIEGGRVPW